MSVSSTCLRLSKTGLQYGMFIELASPAAVEMAGTAGWDFVVVDCEHAPIGRHMLPQFSAAAAAANTACVIRVPECSAAWVQAALDCGAAGIQIPQISSLAMARQAVEWARFHPQGKRGFNPFVRAAGYSLEPPAEFMARSNGEVALILQLESAEAVAAAAEIARVPGVDSLFVGPYDLSQSLGIPGEVNHPSVMEAGRKVMAECAAAGLAGGVFVNTKAAAEAWRQAGAKWISYSSDTYLLAQAMANLRRSV